MKINEYITGIEEIIQTKGALFTAEELLVLVNAKDFLNRMASLVSEPITEAKEYIPPVEIPSFVPTKQTTPAPAAVKLSSLVTPEVGGCIAAQPASVKQAAAQAQLDAMLQEKKSQDSLEESFRQQLQSKEQAPATIAPAASQTAPTMSLEEFTKQKEEEEKAKQQAAFEAALKEVQATAPSAVQASQQA